LIGKVKVELVEGPEIGAGLRLRAKEPKAEVGAEGTAGRGFTAKELKAEARGGGLGAGVVGAEIEVELAA
jgi:hypothetical protein